MEDTDPLTSHPEHNHARAAVEAPWRRFHAAQMNYAVASVTSLARSRVSYRAAANRAEVMIFPRAGRLVLGVISSGIVSTRIRGTPLSRSRSASVVSRSTRISSIAVYVPCADPGSSRAPGSQCETFHSSRQIGFLFDILSPFGDCQNFVPRARKTPSLLGSDRHFDHVIRARRSWRKTGRPPRSYGQVVQEQVPLAVKAPREDDEDQFLEILRAIRGAERQSSRKVTPRCC